VGNSTWLRAALFLLFFGPFSAFAGEPAKVERTIAKEPNYKGKPRYCQLVFGPKASEWVWLVQDGEVLYVDRRGNGDLTGAECKILAAKTPERTVEGRFDFEVTDLTVGGRVHKKLMVHLRPLTQYAEGSLGKRAEVKAALAKDAHAAVASIYAEVDVPGLKGSGVGRRARFLAGPADLTGVLLLGDSPANAPIVHFGGPLQVTFYSERPTLRLGRSTDMVLVVGTPGEGPGTFAMVAYEDTIPEQARPVAEIAFPSARPGGAPIVERFELKQRC
jgi:hypothetical protein